MDVLTALLNSRLGCEVQATRRAGDAGELTRRAVDAGFERVVAAGGDGTVSEVLGGIAPAFEKVCFGVIPLGTGNDLARSLDIPHDIEQAVEVLLTGQTRRIDVGRITAQDEHYFINSSGLGFVPMLNEEVSPQTKHWLGRWAYHLAGLKAIPRTPEYRVKLVLDDQDRLDIDLYNILVSNGRYIGGGIDFAPHARIDDGLADIVIVPTIAVSQLPELFARILQGDPQQMEELQVYRARRFHIESEPPIPFNADGEPVGESPVTYEILERALETVTGPHPLAE